MKSLLFTLVLLIGLTSYSQNGSKFESYFSVKAGLNLVDSAGDHAPFDALSNPNEAAFTNPYALGIDYRFSRLFSVGLFGSINKWKAGEDVIDTFVITEDFNYSSIDLSLKFYLDELIFSSKEDYKRDWLDLYLTAGGGYFTIWDSELSANLGAGANVWITDNFGVNIEGMGKFSGEIYNESSNHFQYFAGLTYRFGKKKDPDSDNDGIIDIKDKCPEAPGVLSNDGCPEPKDTDGDGIIDDEDKCPNTAGVSSENGCPEPPKDTDGDGIVDDEDDCPNIVGSSVNKGCPEVVKPDPVVEKPTINEEEIRKNILLISKDVLFDVDSYELTSESIAKLDKIIEYLRLIPNSDLFISGHTDSTGSTSHNQTLSIDRANIVKRYITDSGAPVGSIVTEGLDESDPVASNLSIEGRRKNRRIEIYLNNN